MTSDDYHLRFGGIERLYGRKALHAFHHAHIAIVGLGGVGSWAAEALARSGIGAITLIDLRNRDRPSLADMSSGMFVPFRRQSARKIH